MDLTPLLTDLTPFSAFPNPIKNVLFLLLSFTALSLPTPLSQPVEDTYPDLPQPKYSTSFHLPSFTIWISSPSGLNRCCVRPCIRGGMQDTSSECGTQILVNLMQFVCMHAPNTYYLMRWYFVHACIQSDSNCSELRSLT